MSSMMCGMLLGAGVVSKKTYIDDIFATTIYKGQSTPSTVNTGIDMSSGGMAWVKNRASGNHAIGTQELGAGYLVPNGTSALDAFGNGFNTFTSTGFTTTQGNAAPTNENGNNYVAWSWKKTPGFFDVVTWTGNATARTIAHSLGCIPGMIIVKRTNASEDWTCYHRNLGGISQSGQYPAQQEFIDLNNQSGAQDGSVWNNTLPTSTHFSLGTHARVNGNNDTYVAYLFAGGKSTSDNAVSFDGTDDRLTLADSSDFTFGTGDFTVEGWFNKIDAAATGFFQISDTTGGIKASTTDSLAFYYSSFNSSITLVYNDTYHHQSYSYTPDKYCHFAVCRQGSTIKVFIDGVELISRSDSKDYDFGNLCIGGSWDTNILMKGKIANFRIVKGQALYTQGFTPTTEVFTTSSRDVESSKVKLICCNGSTTTAATVTPGTITAVGNPTVASSESIFDDTAANSFGESGDQNVIKCGSYVGTGGSTGLPEINLGFEPQWLLVKNASSGSTDWYIVDTMRGFGPHNIIEQILKANSNVAEDNGDPYSITSTGWSLYDSADDVNQNGDTYIYMAIRRSDGYVGKPPELGTGVFAMDTGNSSSTIPVFDSNFPVDLALARQTANSGNWFVYGRLIQKKYLITNTTASMATSNGALFDSNVGYSTQSTFDSGYQSWMWKRHAGFDVLVYEGDGVSGRQIRHNLGPDKVPQMMWVKAIDGANSHVRDWRVFHNGLNGGSNPEQYGIKLNSTDAESQNSGYWNDTAPTSTNFTVGNSNNVNDSGLTYIAMLFASVDGISSVGSYSGSSSAVTVTTGFQPRFLIIKSTSSASNYNWYTWDTVRGWGSGNDYHISLNKNQAQSSSGLDMGGPTSTGFTVNSIGGFNSSGQTFVYYAHA